MRLSKIMEGVGASRMAGPPGDPEIDLVTCDSRRAGNAALFFALPGTKADGTAYAREAVERGAVAVVAERPIEGLPPGVIAIQAPNGRRAMAMAAANFHGRPASAMTVLGVTGTKGKTTTTFLAEAMLAAAGEHPGLIGTVSYRYAGRSLPAPNTTPESTELHALLAQMRESGTTSVAMEVSSHALAQDRVWGLSFTSAAFTNLTRDHLDYHRDMEDYFCAKRRLLVEMCTGPAVLNGDDPYGVRLADELVREGRPTWRFSVESRSAELWADETRFSVDGIEGTLNTPRGRAAFRTSLIGSHNLQNVLTAAGLVLGAGFGLEAVVKGIGSLTSVPGRLEQVGGQKFRVFVDYAHTDDALRRTLAALRPFTRGRLICVFGCGGDRDRGKRPMMGEAAGRASELIIVTSDNPRTEEPAAIAGEILPGLAKAGSALLSMQQARAGERGCLLELDRRKAIEMAVACARPGDVVLIAGKGHESTQIVGSEKRRFDDREEARRALGIDP
jgi:UDP-N-acetylmuramoyl-L-alanyl-D-glutamate--2,6-diaminopimelate ligase